MGEGVDCLLTAWKFYTLPPTNAQGGPFKRRLIFQVPTHRCFPFFVGGGMGIFPAPQASTSLRTEDAEPWSPSSPSLRRLSVAMLRDTQAGGHLGAVLRTPLHWVLSSEYEVVSSLFVGFSCVFFLRGRAGRLVIKLKGSQRRKKVFSGSITHTHFLHQHVPFGVSQTKHEASDRIGVQGSSKGACFNRQLPSIPLTQFPQATSHNKRKGLWGFSARLWLPRTGVLRLHVCL